MIEEPIPPVGSMSGYRCQEIGVSGGEPGEVGKNLWDEGKWWVEVNGMVTCPINGEEVSVSVSGVMEADAEAGKLGVHGRCHSIHLRGG